MGELLQRDIFELEKMTKFGKPRRHFLSTKPALTEVHEGEQRNRT